jgi:broad specificity phosphatase PhoE
VWRSWLARTAGGREVAGSSPVTPTREFIIMTKKCTLYLVRHGESISNKNGMVGGQTDFHLTEEGRAQAEATKRALQQVHFDELYSSDLIRTIDTAEIIAGRPVKASHRLSDLRERNFGSLEGRTHAEFARLRASQHEIVQAMNPAERWAYDYGTGMESNEVLSNRTMKALIEIANNNLDKTVLIAMHGGPIRTTLVKLGYADEKDLPPGSFSNGGYVVLGYDGKQFTVERAVGINKRESYSE